ncbi:MAG: carboxypeptidase-like regulatory domain-containing protein [Bacteroidetes bacterium]|nr:carboxypeptidase-like regulatory domain-containing protein [Bacteroidota bacterium]
MDSLTRQPIAFASIMLDDNRTGTSSDIEGKFTLMLPANYTGKVTVSHVSYEKKLLGVNYFHTHRIVALMPSTTLLQMVAVTATKAENPAFRIIRQAIAHKKEHDPDHLKSYEYISYNKFLVTMSAPSAHMDSVIQQIKAGTYKPKPKIKQKDLHTSVFKKRKSPTKPDTVKIKKNRQRLVSFDSLVRTTHFFLSESVTEKQKINPDKEKEKLLALQVSGFKSPLFTNVATDYQPFSFYKDNISLLQKDFINPISKGTFGRYDFYLADTTYYNADTIFTIRYKPKTGKLFNGLKGMVSICTDGFAIKNVIATSADSLAPMGIRIQQNYEKIDGHWFPVQLNTDMDFYHIIIIGRHMLIQHQSFLKDIKINPILKASSFGDMKVELSLPKQEENRVTLNHFRNGDLDFKEKRTYKLVDSTMRKVRWMDKVIETLVTQTVPIGFLDLDLTKISKVNRYESFRLGAGLYTNDRFSKWVRVGGYAGYGFRDEQWKYGGEMKFNFNLDKDFFVRFSYAKDIYETGSSHINREGQLPGSESFRVFISSRYDRIETYKAEIGYRVFSDVHATFFTSRNQINPTYNYQLAVDNQPSNQFLIAETGVNLRYVHDESYMSLRGKKIFLGQRFPVFTFSYAQATPWYNAQSFNYSKFDFSAKQLFKHRNGSKTRFYFAAGVVNGVAPYGKLYTGRGASSTGYLVDDYFQTMGIYEFTASKYASFFLNHNFGNILLNKKYSKPELVLYHNMGVGILDNQSAQLGLTLQSFDKGFYESGIGLNNLIRGNYANVARWGVGGGVFYRYGSYQFQKTENNLAAKFLFSLSF